MAKVKRFEELECWREARDFVQLIYGLTEKDPFRKDFELPWTKNILVNLKLKRYRNKQKLYGKKSIISSLICNVTQSKGIPKPIQPIELIKQRYQLNMIFCNLAGLKRTRNHLSDVKHF